MPLNSPRRANAVASLAHTGHLSPAGRRPVGGARQHAQLPGSAARPGPRPLSARQLAAVNAQNARIRRAVEQTASECRRAIEESNRQMQRRAQSLSFSQYDFDKRQSGRDAVHETMQLPGTYRQLDVTRYTAGSLWIYATTLHDGWGDHQYFVYNPDTGAILQFTPEASRLQASYASRRAQIQGTAAGTGVVGGYLEKGFGVLALGGVGLAVAVEAGGYYVLTEQVAPTVSRIAVRAWQIARPGLRAYGQQAWKGMSIRVGTDFFIQFSGGFTMGKGSALDRTEQALKGINGMSLVVSALVHTNGPKLSTLSKWLVAGGSAVAGNLVTVSGENQDKYGGYWHGVDFHDVKQADGFLFNVILGTLLDRGRDGLVEKWGDKLVENAAQATRPLTQAALRWVNVTRVQLGLNMSVGFNFESGKKWLENKWGGESEETKPPGKGKPAQTQPPARPNPNLTQVKR